MKIIPIIILSIFLTGCACFKKPDDVVIDTPKVANINAKVLEPCALLPETGAIKTFEEVLDAYGNLASLYGTCAVKQNNSIVVIKQFGNIP